MINTNQHMVLVSKGLLLLLINLNHSLLQVLIIHHTFSLLIFKQFYTLHWIFMQEFTILCI